MFDLHNKYRANHGVESLVLDPQLNIHAQEWAEKLEAWGKLETGKNVIGENCFLSSTHHLIAAHAVNVWYSERFDFDWNGDYENQQGTEHFTQIIWRGTKKMGAGYKSGSNGTYIVAVYVPPGNIPGHFKENVFPILPELDPSKPKSKFQQMNRKLMAQMRMAKAFTPKASAVSTAFSMRSGKVTLVPPADVARKPTEISSKSRPSNRLGQRESTYKTPTRNWVVEKKNARGSAAMEGKPIASKYDVYSRDTAARARNILLRGDKHTTNMREER
jgi:hypothetical protein